MSKVEYELFINTDKFKSESKKTQEDFLKDFQAMDAKLLKEQEQYYNTVKAADQNYYEWKKAKYVKDAQDLGLSEEQKQKYIKETFATVQKEQEQTEKPPKTGAFLQAWGFATLAITGTIAAINQAWQAFSAFFEAANAANLALKGLSETARVFGQDQEQANKYAKQLASDGLLNITQAAGGLKLLLASGFNISEAMNLSTSLKDIGAFNNVVGDLNQAMYDVARGIKTGSVELIENIGFTQRLSSVMKQANIDISNGIDITNNAAQRRALYNAIINEGAKFEGNAAKLAQESAGQYLKLGQAWEVLKQKIGDLLNTVLVPIVTVLGNLAKFIGDNLNVVLAVLIGAITGLIPLIWGMVPALTAVTTQFVAWAGAVTVATGGLNLLLAALGATAAGIGTYIYQQNKASESMNALNNKFKQQTTDLNLLIATYEYLRDKTAKTQAEHELLAETITKLKNGYPDYLKNLDFEKNSHAEIDKALNRTNEALLQKYALQKLEVDSADKLDELLQLRLKEKELLRDQIAVKLEAEKGDLSAVSRVEKLNMLLDLNRQAQAETNKELNNQRKIYLDTFKTTSLDVKKPIDNEARIKAQGELNNLSVKAETETEAKIRQIREAAAAERAGGLAKELYDLKEKHQKEIKEAAGNADLLKVMESEYQTSRAKIIDDFNQKELAKYSNALTLKEALLLESLKEQEQAQNDLEKEIAESDREQLSESLKNLDQDLAYTVKTNEAKLKAAQAIESDLKDLQDRIFLYNKQGLDKQLAELEINNQKQEQAKLESIKKMFAYTAPENATPEQVESGTKEAEKQAEIAFNDWKILNDQDYLNRRAEITKAALEQEQEQYKAVSQILQDSLNAGIDAAFNYRREKSDEQYQLDIEAVQLSAQSRIDAIDEELKKATISEIRKKQLINERRQLELNTTKQIADLEKKRDEDNQSRGEKALKAGFKAGIASIASLASAEAFKSVLSIIPFPLNLILAPVAGATAYAGIQSIGALAGFKEGRFTGFGADDEPAGIVHKNEYVFTADAVRKIGLANLEALHSGYQQGGYTNNNFITVPNPGISVNIPPIPAAAVTNTVQNNYLSSISERVGAVSANIAEIPEPETKLIIINNSDFVGITTKVESTKNTNKFIGRSKTTGEYSNA